MAPTKASSVAAPRASSVTVASVALLLITLAAAVVVGFTSRQAWVAHLDEVRANATRDLDAVRAELGTATECCTAKRAEASARAAELHRTAAALTTQEAAALAASREAEAAHAAHREAAAAAAAANATLATVTELALGAATELAFGFVGATAAASRRAGLAARRAFCAIAQSGSVKWMLY